MRVAFGVNMFPEYIGYARDKTGLHLELVALVQREGGADNYLIVHPQEFDQFQMGRPHIEMVLEAISRSGMIGGSHEIFIQPTGSTEFLSLPDLPPILTENPPAFRYVDQRRRQSSTRLTRSSPINPRMPMSGSRQILLERLRFSKILSVVCREGCPKPPIVLGLSAAK